MAKLSSDGWMNVSVVFFLLCGNLMPIVNLIFPSGKAYCFLYQLCRQLFRTWPRCGAACSHGCLPLFVVEEPELGDLSAPHLPTLYSPLLVLHGQNDQLGWTSKCAFYGDFVVRDNIIVGAYHEKYPAGVKSSKNQETQADSMTPLFLSTGSCTGRRQALSTF